MPLAVAIRHISTACLIAHLGIHIQFVERAAAFDVAFQSVETVIQLYHRCGLHCLAHLACKVHLVLDVQTVVARHHLSVFLRVAGIEHRRVCPANLHLITFDNRGLPTLQVGLTGLVTAGYTDTIGIEEVIPHVIIVFAYPPFASLGIEVPLRKRIKVRLAINKRDGAPLVEAVTIAGKTSPAVAAVDDGLLLRAAHGIEETRLRHVSVVVGRTRHNLHTVGWRVGTVDATGFQVIHIRGIPAVEVARAHVILILILEHTVALAPAALVNLMTVLQANLAIRAHANLRQIDTPAAFTVAIAEVRLARIGIREYRHIARVWRANDAGHVNLVMTGIVACRRRTRSHQHMVVELCQQRIFLGLCDIGHAQAPHPVGPAGSIGRQHITHIFPVHQIITLVAGHAQEVRHIALTWIDALRTVVHCLLILCTVPIIMLHALRIRETEDAPTLTVDVAASSGLPERVVCNHIIGLRGCRNSQQTEHQS